MFLYSFTSLLLFLTNHLSLPFSLFASSDCWLIMAPKKAGVSKRVFNKGSWTAEEDRRLAKYIEIHGAKRWKTIAIKSGLNRCGKSCRLRWLNYLRPNIKRGNISDEEEDLIIRLHKLLGNRWSLIAGRLPGRTDNEIKNYWNSHLSKKMINHDVRTEQTSSLEQIVPYKAWETVQMEEEEVVKGSDEIENSEFSIDVDEFFDFSTEGCFGLDWVNKFLELDDQQDPLAMV
ncbi:hypothetical protein Gorai_015151 [Gossypium raimondii]|uniref:Uncharacterized protein n=2 Tax=Gossypium raimondii TaxID=29730 RepID=A0A0D2S2S7_GOSRA|nr:hypothetical protein B456_004G196800 [Gossypium raimondii]MBA0584334.1 hypothetical protein [Gossypium raimondii]